MINVFGCNTSQEEIDELSPSVRSGWMGMGKRVREFEAAFERRLGAPFAMVDSGSNALHVAVKVLELPPASEVIVPSFTWVACAQTVLLAGHRPVFADVDIETHNITRDTIEAARTPRTRAVMVVHYAGKPVRMEALADLGLPVIEDAAHAVDSTLNGRYCGAIADVGIYSFDAVKNLATPDGGGVVSRNPSLVDKAKYLRYCGIGKSGFDSVAGGGKSKWWEYDIKDVFPRCLPNDLSASIGLVQLRKLEKHQARRKQIWDHYHQELAHVDWLRTPQNPLADETHSYFTYLIRVLDGRRDRLAQTLLDQGIYTTLRYHPLHLNPIYRWDGPRLPVSEQLNQQGLNLPLHPKLTDDEVTRVIDAVKAFGRAR